MRSYRKSEYCNLVFLKLSNLVSGIGELGNVHLGVE